MIANKKIAITDNNSRLTYNSLLSEIAQYDQKQKKCVSVYMIRHGNYLLTFNLKSELKTNVTGEHQISRKLSHLNVIIASVGLASQMQSKYAN